MVKKKDREEMYQLYKKYYKGWMQKNELVDENDLVRKTYKALKEANMFEQERFQFMVIDEIQDYTELQIYFLSELVENKDYIVMAGDRNQIINPTMFDEERMESLYRKFNEKRNESWYRSKIRKDLRIQVLTENFRCQKEIVNMANSLSKLRNARVGIYENRSEEKSHKEGCPIMRLAYSDRNIKNVVLKLLDYPDVAVLVANEEEKEKLINIIGKDAYEGAENKIIHYVAEIKGMEYKYILCVDILSQDMEEWRRIIQNEKVRNTRFRYYFNLFYVAITRARNYLCIMEEGPVEIIYDELKKYESKPVKYEWFKTYDFRKLHLNALTNDSEDWYASAERNFDNGLYDVALEHYKKANASIEKIALCKAEIAASKLKEEVYKKEALRQYIIAKHKDGLKRYQKGFMEIEPKLVTFILEPELAINSVWFALWDMEADIKSFFDETDFYFVKEYLLQIMEWVAEKQLNNWNIEEVLSKWES
ncbi:MAG: UvrD-helicase domain-containing protein [Lachnospiraceae bacterium]